MAIFYCQISHRTLKAERPSACDNSYCVVYTYKHTNGTQKQKWETFTDLADAKKRKKEVEYKESVGTFVAPQFRTLKDLLTEYVALYGKTK